MAQTQDVVASFGGFLESRVQMQQFDFVETVPGDIIAPHRSVPPASPVSGRDSVVISCSHRRWAEPDVCGFFSNIVGSYANGIKLGQAHLVKRGGLEVLHHFPVPRRRGKTASFLRAVLSIPLVEVPMLSTSPKVAKSPVYSATRLIGTSPLTYSHIIGARCRI
jgi:hypothetical protein